MPLDLRVDIHELSVVVQPYGYLAAFLHYDLLFSCVDLAWTLPLRYYTASLPTPPSRRLTVVSWSVPGQD